jgi:hypothetical protein
MKPPNINPRKALTPSMTMFVVLNFMHRFVTTRKGGAKK